VNRDEDRIVYKIARRFTNHTNCKNDVMNMCGRGASSMGPKPIVDGRIPRHDALRIMARIGEKRNGDWCALVRWRLLRLFFVLLDLVL
jgi:hypothetical protein